MNDKQKERVFQQEEPMRCNEMLTNGQLHTHYSIQDFFKNKKSESSIIFIDHPSLNMGDVIPLINLWKNDQKNTLIWITPTDNLVEILNNFQPLYLNVQYCPIDIRLNDKQFKDLIVKINPKEVLLPESHFKPSRLSVTYPDDGLYLKYGQKSYHLYDRHNIKTAYITEELAKKQFPKYRNESCLYYFYRGLLEFSNGKIYIKSIKAYEDDDLDLKYEEINLQDLCQKLTNAGFGETLIEKDNNNSTIIKLPVYHSLIKFNNRSILIETNNNRTRKKILTIMKRIFDVDNNENEVLLTN